MYEPTNWKTGDVVTSAKLNKLEKGVEDSGLAVHLTITQEGGTMTVTLDKTYRQIVTAIENGFMPILLSEDDGGYSLDTIAMFYQDSGEYAIQTRASSLTFKTATEDGYPTFTQGDQH